MTLTEDIWRQYHPKGIWRNDLNRRHLKKLLHLSWRMLKTWLSHNTLQAMTTLELKEFEDMTFAEYIWRHYQTKGMLRNDIHRITLKTLLHLNRRTLKKLLRRKTFQESITLELKDLEDMTLAEVIWRRYQPKGIWRNDLNRIFVKTLLHLNWRNWKTWLRQKNTEDIYKLKLKDLEDMT